MKSTIHFVTLNIEPHLIFFLSETYRRKFQITIESYEIEKMNWHGMTVGVYINIRRTHCLLRKWLNLAHLMGSFLETQHFKINLFLIYA